MRLDRKMTRGEMNKLVQDILTQLGLQSCAENRIGGDGSKKVISGGEKKRLSFATEVSLRMRLILLVTSLFCFIICQVVDRLLKTRNCVLKILFFSPRTDVNKSSTTVL